MSNDQLRVDALEYHSSEPRGKVTVVPTKPHGTQRSSLLLTPGVAYPCEEIRDNPAKHTSTLKGEPSGRYQQWHCSPRAGRYWSSSQQASNGGKGLLFKAFADIDVFDIEVDRTDVDGFVEAVKAIAPTFGGINLEDIGAPECFEIEEGLQKSWTYR